jgi:hypothetical protein
MSSHSNAYSSIPARFTRLFRKALGTTQPPKQWVWEALSPGVELPGREADNSPQSNSEVKNDGSIPPLPHITSRTAAYLSTNSISARRVETKLNIMRFLVLIAFSL